MIALPLSKHTAINAHILEEALTVGDPGRDDYPIVLLKDSRPMCCEVQLNVCKQVSNGGKMEGKVVEPWRSGVRAERTMPSTRESGSAPFWRF